MSKPLRSRPIGFCLEENSDGFRFRGHPAEMHNLPGTKRGGVASYSGVRSLRGLLIGHGSAGLPIVRFRPPPPFSKEDTKFTKKLRKSTSLSELRVLRALLRKLPQPHPLTLCPRCHSEPQAKNLAFVTVRKTRCFAALSMTSLPYAPFSSSRGERKLMVHFVVLCKFRTPRNFFIPAVRRSQRQEGRVLIFRKYFFLASLRVLRVLRGELS